MSHYFLYVTNGLSLTFVKFPAQPRTVKQRKDFRLLRRLGRIGNFTPFSFGKVNLMVALEYSLSATLSYNYTRHYLKAAFNWLV